MLTETQIDQVTTLLATLWKVNDTVKLSDNVIKAGLKTIAMGLSIEIKEVLTRWAGITGNLYTEEDLESKEIKRLMLRGYTRFVEAQTTPQVMQVIHIEL